MIGRSMAGLLSAAALSLGMTAPARADDVADSYRGKRISLVIGYGTGGGYDLYARMLGRFMGDHVPGKPTIIAQNMPGAGSRGAANWLYKVAPPRDGTVIATVSQTTPTDQVLDQPGIQFDVRKLNWIGNMVIANNLLFVFAGSGVTSLEPAKRKPLAIGATGASTPSVLYPQVSNNLLGTKFRIVSGYPSGGDINIALERGEVDGHVDSWASIKSSHPDWLRGHAVNLLFQVGAKREAELPDVPLWSELGQIDEQRQILEILSGDMAIGRPIVTAPDVPPERVRALRRAFDDTLMDPSFIDAANKAHMDSTRSAAKSCSVS
jgi:tripartite-type tricarboxylate transporter receptor subunit TctC